MPVKKTAKGSILFTVDKLIHDGEIYDYINDFDFDLEFYRKWCKRSGGPCLELCCGTGRLTVPLAESGIDITGVDYTASMLNRARQKARKKELSIEFVRQDIRKLDLKDGRKARKFSMIFIPFNSLQCLYTLEDLEKLFGRVKAHLAEDAIFVIDIFNPSIEIMVGRSKGWKLFKDFKTSDGRRIVITEQCAYDAASEVNRVLWKYSIDGNESVRRLDMRCLWPLEMDAILKYNGFEIVNKFGDYNGSSFKSESSKQLYILKTAS